jgi:hypothetical protein
MSAFSQIRAICVVGQRGSSCPSDPGNKNTLPGPPRYYISADPNSIESTFLAKGENPDQVSEHNGVDLDMLNRSPSEGLAPANFSMPADFGEPRCLFLLQSQSSQEMRTAFRTPATRNGVEPSQLVKITGHE